MKPRYGAALAAGALLTAVVAGCSNSDSTTATATSTHTTTTIAHATTTSATATSTHSTSPQATTTAPPATKPAVNLTGPSPAPLPPPSPTHPPAPAPAPAEIVEDINCGPVTDAGGTTRHVIAVGSAAGRVGCTEAVTIATRYVTTIAPSDAVTVDGWDCNAQPDAVTPSMCAKDGLVIGLRVH